MELIAKHRGIVAKYASEFQDETEIQNLQKKLVKDYLMKKKKISLDSFQNNEYSINKLDKLKKIKTEKVNVKKKGIDSNRSKALNKGALEFDKFSLNIDLAGLEKPKKKEKKARKKAEKNLPNPFDPNIEPLCLTEDFGDVSNLATEEDLKSTKCRSIRSIKFPRSSRRIVVQPKANPGAPPQPPLDSVKYQQQIGPAEKLLTNYLLQKMDKDDSGSQLFDEFNRVRYQVLIDRLKSIKVEKPDQDRIYEFCDMLERKEFELDHEALRRFLGGYKLNLGDWLKIAPEDMAAKKKSEAIIEFNYRRHIAKKAKNKDANQILNPEPVSKETFNYERATLEEGFNAADYLVKVRDEQNKTMMTYAGVNENLDSDKFELSKGNPTHRGSPGRKNPNNGKKHNNIGTLNPITYSGPKRSQNVQGPTGSLYPFQKYSNGGLGVGAENDNSKPNCKVRGKRNSMGFYPTSQVPEPNVDGEEDEEQEGSKHSNKMFMRGHTVTEAGFVLRSKFGGQGGGLQVVRLPTGTDKSEKSESGSRSSESPGSEAKTRTDITQTNFRHSREDLNNSPPKSLVKLASKSMSSEEIIHEESIQGTLEDEDQHEDEDQIFLPKTATNILEDNQALDLSVRKITRPPHVTIEPVLTEYNLTQQIVYEPSPVPKKSVHHSRNHTISSGTFLPMKASQKNGLKTALALDTTKLTSRKSQNSSKKRTKKTSPDGLLLNRRNSATTYRVNTDFIENERQKGHDILHTQTSRSQRRKKRVVDVVNPQDYKHVPLLQLEQVCQMRRDLKDVMDEIKESKRQAVLEFERKKKKGWSIGMNGVPTKGANKYAWVESRFLKSKMGNICRLGSKTCRERENGDLSTSRIQEFNFSPPKSALRRDRNMTLAAGGGNLRLPDSTSGQVTDRILSKEKKSQSPESILEFSGASPVKKSITQTSENHFTGSTIKKPKDGKTMLKKKTQWSKSAMGEARIRMPVGLKDVTKDNPIYQRIFEKFDNSRPQHGNCTTDNIVGNAKNHDCIKILSNEHSACGHTDTKIQKEYQKKTMCRQIFNESVLRNKQMTKTLPKFRRAHMNLISGSVDMENPFAHTSNPNHLSYGEHQHTQSTTGFYPLTARNLTNNQLDTTARTNNGSTLSFSRQKLTDPHNISRFGGATARPNLLIELNKDSSNMSLSVKDYGVTARSTRRFKVTNKNGDTLDMIDACNNLESSCKSIISQKNRLCKNFDYVTRSYKNELKKFKGNLHAPNQKPSYEQRKELLKIRERTEFNNAIANYIMCTLVDKRRTAHACRDTIKAEHSGLQGHEDENCVIPDEFRQYGKNFCV